jgi:hypothetical protein
MPFTSKSLLTLEERIQIADMKEEIKLAKQVKRAKPSEEELKQMHYDRADKKEQARAQKAQERQDRREAVKKQRLDNAKARHQKTLASLQPASKPIEATQGDMPTTELDDEVIITKVEGPPCQDDISTDCDSD